MVLMMPINGFVAVKQRKLQIIQMKLKDERIKLMNEVLGGIKVSLWRMFSRFVFALVGPESSSSNTVASTADHSP